MDSVSSITRMLYMVLPALDLSVVKPTDEGRQPFVSHMLKHNLLDHRLSDASFCCSVQRFPDLVKQRYRIERFFDEAYVFTVAPPAAHYVLRITGHAKDLAVFPDRPEPLYELTSAHIRHDDICHDEVNRLLQVRADTERIFSVNRFEDRIPLH